MCCFVHKCQERLMNNKCKSCQTMTKACGLVKTDWNPIEADLSGVRH